MNVNFFSLFHDRRSRSQVICEVLRPHLNGRVLEVGSGDCYLIDKMNRLDGIEAHGVDVKDYNQVPGLKTFQLYDGKHLPFANESFDVIIAVYVIHHIRDQTTVLMEMMRTLKPGGKIILLEDSFNGPIGRKVAEFYDRATNLGAFQVDCVYSFHTPAEWRDMLEAQLGLRVEVTRPLKLGPLCRILPQSFYFKLLLVARKITDSTS
jgi:ubiquinone/menaquinone biosynthesis C-methylase UbiE